MHDDHPTPGPGHNARPAQQWQTPHLPHSHDHPEDDGEEPDLDLVEAAFVEGFERAPDPTSFIRRAGVPFKSERDRTPLDLVRQPCRPPPPARFPYLMGDRLVRLGLAEARALPNLTPPR
jgi:hypothetical protein